MSKCISLRVVFLFILLLFSSHVSAYEVLVTVAPHRFFVEKIAGNTLSVGVIVPAGASSHTYEPTPRQTMAAGQAVIWFQIGESFEKHVGQALQNHNSRLQLIDLQQGIDLIHEHQCCHHHKGSVDPHFWLSAREAKVQAATIAKVLSDTFPQHKQLYEDNLQKFVEELQALDGEIAKILGKWQNRTILVSHPAYGYFCRDYHIKQLSVEFEGKDPTPQQLTRLLQEAKASHIKKIFIQMQYSNKGAKLIAEHLGAELVTLDPYSEKYMETMVAIAKAFAAS